MNPTPKISVVIPVYKNEETLTELHRRLTSVLLKDVPGGTRYEVLYVNDDSPDDSFKVLKLLVERDDRVGVVSMAHNVGQQRAVMTGVGHSRGENVIVLDADLQDPPEAIPTLVEKLSEGYEAVFAGRRGNYQVTRRMITSRLFKRVLATLTGVPPDAGIYVAVSRRMVEALLAYNESRPYLVGMIGCTWLPVTSIPIERVVRPMGKSSYTALSRLVIGLGAIFRAIFKWRRGARPSSPEITFPVQSRIGQPFSVLIESSSATESSMNAYPSNSHD
jgi:glycosyltransferase involved in cell wall biosynthesis